MTTLRSLFKTFYIRFEFFIARHTPDKRNLVHLTVGSNSGYEGDRIPGIWLDKSNLLWIISSINGDSDYRYIHTVPIKMSQWYKLEIDQVLIENQVGIAKIF